MIRKILIFLPYSKMDFKFISNHYDIHLEGSCIYENKLCEFKTFPGYWDKDNDDCYESFCEIYKLNLFEKIEWLWKQWLFEKCIGYHYSYKNNKKLGNFYYRTPKWFYNMIFNLYYAKITTKTN